MQFKNHRPSALAAVGAALCLATGPIHAASYEVTNLKPLFEGWQNVELADINNRGEIAGKAYNQWTLSDPLGNAFGFVYSAGTVTNITGYGFDGYVTSMNDKGDVVGSVTSKTLYNTKQPFVYAGSTGQLTAFAALNPGGSWDSAYDINNAGQIVGDSTPDDHGVPNPYSFYSHPFLYQNGSAQDLGTLGGPYWSAAQAINDKGQIVGYASSSTYGHTHAFLYQDGSMLDLGTLGGTASWARDINEAGVIVGQADSPDGSHAFIYRNGQMTQLDDFGAHLSAAGTINARGEVLGSYRKPDGNSVYFYYSDETGCLSLDELLDPASGWTLTSVIDINDLGQIIGKAQRGSEIVPVLLTPVPEASSLALMSLGMAAVSVAAASGRGRAARRA